MMQAAVITFKSKASANVTMHGPIAIELLKMMGKSGSVPGAMTASNIQITLETLKDRISQLQNKRLPQDSLPEDKNNQHVDLHVRALPLIQMLARAAEKGCDVMWDEGF